MSWSQQKGWFKRGKCARVFSFLDYSMLLDHGPLCILQLCLHILSYLQVKWEVVICQVELEDISQLYQPLLVDSQEACTYSVNQENSSILWEIMELIGENLRWSKVNFTIIEIEKSIHLIYSTSMINQSISFKVNPYLKLQIYIEINQWINSMLFILYGISHLVLSTLNWRLNFIFNIWRKLEFFI